jgi:hypothetical protein
MDQQLYHVPRGGIPDSSASDLRGHLAGDSSFNWKARYLTAIGNKKKGGPRPAVRNQQLTTKR